MQKKRKEVKQLQSEKRSFKRLNLIIIGILILPNRNSRTGYDFKFKNEKATTTKMYSIVNCDTVLFLSKMTTFYFLH